MENFLQNLPEIINNARSIWDSLENICRLAGVSESFAYWLAAAVFGIPIPVTFASFLTRFTKNTADNRIVFFIKKFFEFVALNAHPVKLESKEPGTEDCKK